MKIRKKQVTMVSFSKEKKDIDIGDAIAALPAHKPTATWRISRERWQKSLNSIREYKKLSITICDT